MGPDLNTTGSTDSRAINSVDDNVLSSVDNHAAENFDQLLASSPASLQPEQSFGVSIFSAGEGAQGAGSVDLPDPPPVSSASGSGDGQGAHGSTERSWWDIPGKTFDEGKKQVFHEGADLFDTIGRDNAARHMRHYLGNTGDTLEMSPDAMMNDMPEFRRDVEDHTENELTQQINEHIAENYTGEQTTFQVTTDWNSDFYATPELSQDWYFATGGFSYSQGASVTVTPSADGGPPAVDVTYQTHVFDRYNWDEGKSVEIAGVTITDETIGDLHERGIAQEFDLEGSSEPQSFSYEYDPAFAAATDPDVTNDPPDTDERTRLDDPTRNPDRSRNSGDRDNEPIFR